MSLSTFSKFYYLANEIDDSNRYLDIDEGAGELTAVVDVGSYTPEDLMLKIKTALDAVGTNTYVVAFDRTTRIVTISADATFDILASTGTNASRSILPEIGFSTAADFVAADPYSGTTPTGSEYIVQFVLQSYLDPNKIKEKIDTSINESASGIIESISFGTRRFIQMDFKYITNKPQDCSVIRNNPTGVEDFEALLDHLIEKRPVEFMPDKDSVNTLFDLILETTPSNSKGTGYMLREAVDRNLPGYYESGVVKFRVVE